MKEASFGGLTDVDAIVIVAVVDLNGYLVRSAEVISATGEN